MTNSVYGKRIRFSDLFLNVLIYVCAAISVVLLIGIIGYVFYKGIRTVNWKFLTSVTSVLEGTTGIAGNIINTLYIIIITLLISAPIGIGSAIYLNEYAKYPRLTRAIEFTTETLSGIPSIIFGLFGRVFFGEAFHLNYSILTGALTLSLMVLPLITRNTQEALKSVSKSYRNASLGLGATKWYMIRLRSSGNYNRYYTCDRKNSRRICGIAFHIRKRLSPSEKLFRKNSRIGRYAHNSALSFNVKGTI